ncbi:hypothetical protein NQ318_018368 [Aromia moschata]|uniref:DNA-directed DNA polymerase n=1 Tax=Aromia moschata TaxID=1265417 RepID=A0AAV8ZFC6_9CUCU|nr:hypothetical protein NQ318_018368 [Aromia moschata]
MEKFFIVKEALKKVKRFNLTGRTLEFKINPIPTGKEPVSWIKEAINEVIQRGTDGLAPEDQVGFSFCSKEFKRGDGWIRFRPVKEVSRDDIWDMISGVYQSNSTGFSTETFCLGVTSVKMPAGKGRGRLYNSFDEECNMRRGIIVINNKDNMCLPRALVVAIAYVNKDKDQTKVRRDIGKIQTQQAIQLCTSAGVVIPEEGAGIPELQQFQQHLHQYKIVVYGYGGKGREVIFSGSRKGPKLNLIYHEGHYNAITSLTAAFVCVYFCEECHVPYDHKGDHRCGGTCPCCQQSPSCPQGIKIRCDSCKRSFRGQECFDNHKKLHSLGKSTVCDKITRCDDCLKTLKSGRKHVCGEKYCKVCMSHVPQDHLCFMHPDTRKPELKETLFVFYDLETRQEKVLDDGSVLHEPNLCVLSTRCDVCISEKLYFCQKCGFRLIVHREDVIGSFMKYLTEVRKKFKQVIVIAHNGKAFDHQFILNYILVNTDLNPELIMRGTKIISMKMENVKFLDSLNYFPMALSKLPKAFGLGDGFKKAYFPHLFNTIDNSNYVGPLPPLEFYSPDNIKPEERDKFLEWYEAHKQDEFNMQRDLVEYCISDVEILTAACLKFREQLLDTGNVCPFTEACTIASACNKVYRRNFLQPNTIGIIPRGGYRWKDNQSKIAIQWLLWLERTREINILHAGKGKESVVHGVKVDGFCPNIKEIFEFHGCYFHGCEKCFRQGRDVPLHDNQDETMNSRRESTNIRMERLRDFGYTITEIWECEFRKMLKDNGELKTFLENHAFPPNPLNPRDCFYGGRTGNTVEYYKCKAGGKIKYVDVCSLYPWVCKRGKFPPRTPLDIC